MTELPFCYMTFKFMMSEIPKKETGIQKGVMLIVGDVGGERADCSGDVFMGDSDSDSRYCW